MRSNLDNSIYNILALIEKKEFALTFKISEKASISIKMEIEILEKLLLDIADAEKKQDEIRFQEHQAILKLKDQILALESICILHGIYDLPIWLKKDTEALFSEAVRFDRENMVQIPLKLRHER